MQNPLGCIDQFSLTSLFQMLYYCFCPRNTRHFLLDTHSYGKCLCVPVSVRAHLGMCMCLSVSLCAYLCCVCVCV